MSADRKLNLVQADFHMHWGGQAEVVLSLSKSLSRMGQNVTVVSPPGSALEKRATEEGLKTFNGCRFRKGMHLLALYRDVNNLGSFLRDQAIDIYHCHGSQDHWAGALAMSHYALPVQIVRTRHNIYPVHNHVFNRWLFQRQTARVITLFSDQHVSFTKSGLLAADRLFTLHSPLPAEFCQGLPVQPLLRSELHLPPAARLIGYVANLHPDKAPFDFIDAAEQIGAQFPDTHFAIAGFGPLEHDVAARVRNGKCPDRIHVLGFRKDILQVMASLDLIVLPSVAREASSTVLKQAGSLGIPAVASNLGGTREIIDDGVTGLLFPPGDTAALVEKMGAMLREPVKSREMGQRAKTKVLAEFSADAIASRTHELYRTILAAGASH